MNVIREHFESIDRMLTAINSRKNNHKVNSSGCGSQSTSMPGWYGTASYNEAVELIKNGYTKPLEKIKKETANISLSSTAPRRIPKNSVVGYIPNVPNAIRGLPESMINFTTIPQKTKTITVTYVNTSNAGTSANTFITNGITLLNVINKLELNGIRVRLNVAFKFSEFYNEFCFATVTLKDWREQLDLQKICFPICHPSMLRRFGFKWFETCANLTKNYGSNYGRTMSADWAKQQLDIKKHINENEFLLDMNDCEKGEPYILNKLGVKVS